MNAVNFVFSLIYSVVSSVLQLIVFIIIAYFSYELLCTWQLREFHRSHRFTTENVWKQRELLLEGERSRRTGRVYREWVRKHGTEPGAFLHRKYELPHKVADELGRLTTLIVRDFVLDWFAQFVSEDTEFIEDVKELILCVMGNLGRRILRVNLVLFLLCDVTHALRHHLRWYTEMKQRAVEKNPNLFPDLFKNNIQQAKRKSKKEKLSPSKRVVENEDLINKEIIELQQAAVIEQFKAAKHLHPACSGETPEEIFESSTRYLRHVSREIIAQFLPETDHNCVSLRHLLREILTCCVLQPSLEAITPHMLNENFIYLLTVSDEEGNVDDELKDVVSKDKTEETKEKEENPHLNITYKMCGQCPFELVLSNSGLKSDDIWKFYIGDLITEDYIIDLLLSYPMGTFLISPKTFHVYTIYYSTETIKSSNIRKITHENIYFDDKTNLFTIGSYTPKPNLYDVISQVPDLLYGLCFVNKVNPDLIPILERSPWLPEVDDRFKVMNQSRTGTNANLITIPPAPLDTPPPSPPKDSADNSDLQQNLEENTDSLLNLNNEIIEDVHTDNPDARNDEVDICENTISTSTSCPENASDNEENENDIVAALPIPIIQNDKSKLFSQVSIRNSFTDSEISSLNESDNEMMLSTELPQNKMSNDNELNNASNTTDFISKAAARARDDKREELLHDIETAVGNIIGDFVKNPNSSVENEKPALTSLVAALEAVLSYGMISNTNEEVDSKDGRFASSSQDSSVSVRELSYPHENFWPYVLHLSHLLPTAEMIIDLISTGACTACEAAVAVSVTKNESTGLTSPTKGDRDFAFTNDDEYCGPGRAWLYMSLNHSMLAEHLEALIYNEELTRRYYSDASVLLDKNRKHTFLAYIAGLNGVSFSIKLDCFWKPLQSLRGENEEEENDYNSTLSNRKTNSGRFQAIRNRKNYLFSNIGSRLSGFIKSNERVKNRRTSSLLSENVLRESSRSMSCGDVQDLSDKNSDIVDDSKINSSSDSKSNTNERRLSKRYHSDGETDSLDAVNNSTNSKIATEINNLVVVDNYWDPIAKSTRELTPNSSFTQETVVEEEVNSQTSEKNILSERKKKLSELSDISTDELKWTPCKAVIVNAEMIMERRMIQNKTSFEPKRHVEYRIECIMKDHHKEGASGTQQKVPCRPVAWSVTRRYSKFHELNNNLKSKYGKFDIHLPGKRGYKFYAQFEKEFINQRREDLNAYLQRILDDPVLSMSDELNEFLKPLDASTLIDTSQIGDIGESSLYGNSSAITSMKVDGTKMSFPILTPKVGPHSSLQRRRSSAIKSLYSSGTMSSGSTRLRSRTTNEFHEKRIKDDEGHIETVAAGASQGSVHSLSALASASSDASKVELKRASTTIGIATSNKKKKKKNIKSSTLTKESDTTQNKQDLSMLLDPVEMQNAEIHLFELINEIFQFRQMGIFRRNLISLARNVVKFSFHGVLYRWLRDKYTKDASAEQLSSGLQAVRELIWPNDVYDETPAIVPTKEDEERLRKLSRKHIIEGLPPPLISLMGKEQCYEGCLKVHDFVQNPVLLRNLIFTILDLLLLRLFPNLTVESLHSNANN